VTKLGLQKKALQKAAAGSLALATSSVEVGLVSVKKTKRKKKRIVPTATL
jgi:hypothetical protein